MAEAPKKTFIHRLTRHKRQPEAEDPRLDAPVFQPVTGESVAVELRRARQDLGRDLARIADDLKIRRVYLQAIEDGRFDDLPGATYAVGFVRAYAEYLDLDSIEIVGRFKDEVEGLNERLHLVFPTPAPESKIPSGAVLLISILLVALAYGGWYYLSSRHQGMGGQVLDLPKSLEPLISNGGDELIRDPDDTSQRIVLLPAEPLAGSEDRPTTGSPPVPRGTETAPARPRAAALPAPGADDGQPAAGTMPQPVAPASLDTGPPVEIDAEPAADTGADAAVTEPPSAAPAAALAPVPGAVPGAVPGSVLGPDLGPVAGTANLAIPTAPTPEALLPDDESRQPRVYGVENATARIVLRARLDSWVQVHAADESLLLTRVLQPGDSYQVPALDGLTLVTGNAGGLEIEVDGTALPPLGPVGAIRRGIALDPERLLDGSALLQ